MKNSKGQALVEFIIILPIFLMLIMSIIDFANIITKKYSLENDVDIVSDMYKNEKYEDINKYLSNKNIKVSYSSKDNIFIIHLDKEINITSPLLNLIFGKNYEVNVEKGIYKDE